MFAHWAAEVYIIVIVSQWLPVGMAGNGVTAPEMKSWTNNSDRDTFDIVVLSACINSLCVCLSYASEISLLLIVKVKLEFQRFVVLLKSLWPKFSFYFWYTDLNIIKNFL